MNVSGKEAILNQVFQEGHLLANHTEYHKNLRGSIDPVRAIMSTHVKIRSYVRSSEVFLFRAPFGAWKSSHATRLNANRELSQYVGPIFWDIGGEINRRGVQYGAADWACWGRGYSVSACTQGYISESLQHRGGIVLFHDVKPNTAKMLDGYIRTMKAKGYKFVRLDTLPNIRAKR